MLRLSLLFIYLVGFLLVHIPQLFKMKKLAAKDNHLDDPALHVVPKKWAKRFMKMTGSTISIEGYEHMPEGAVVFVGNHESDFDIPLLIGSFEKPLGFVAKKETESIPLISSWMRVIGCVFMDRNSRKGAIHGLKQGIEKVKNGHSLVIFPEGTRNRGGDVLEFKAGSLRLAKDGLAPIVPIVIEGSADIFEKNNRLVKPADVVIRILPAISNAELQNKDMVQLADELRERIISERALLKQRQYEKC